MERGKSVVDLSTGNRRQSRGEGEFSFSDFSAIIKKSLNDVNK